jgi:hypothetical protein
LLVVLARLASFPGRGVDRDRRHAGATWSVDQRGRGIGHANAEEHGDEHGQ